MSAAQCPVRPAAVATLGPCMCCQTPVEAGAEVDIIGAEGDLVMGPYCCASCAARDAARVEVADNAALVVEGDSDAFGRSWRRVGAEVLHGGGRPDDLSVPAIFARALSPVSSMVCRHCCNNHGFNLYALVADDDGCAVAFERLASIRDRVVGTGWSIYVGTAAALAGVRGFAECVELCGRCGCRLVGCMQCRDEFLRLAERRGDSGEGTAREALEWSKFCLLCGTNPCAPVGRA